MISSMLTCKAPTTIPQAVRTALGIGPGDAITYLIVDGQVSLRKLSPATRRAERPASPFVQFDEWNSVHDETDFAGL